MIKQDIPYDRTDEEISQIFQQNISKRDFQPFLEKALDLFYNKIEEQFDEFYEKYKLSSIFHENEYEQIYEIYNNIMCEIMKTTFI